MRDFDYFTNRYATRLPLFETKLVSRARFPKFGQLALEARTRLFRKPHICSDAKGCASKMASSRRLG